MKHLDDSTNAVESNRKLTFGVGLWIALIVTIKIIDKFFYEMPRIGGLWLNIFVMLSFSAVVLWYFFAYMKGLSYVNSYEKRKVSYLLLFVLFYVMGVFLSFHLIGLAIAKSWLKMIIRAVFAVSLGALFYSRYSSIVPRQDK